MRRAASSLACREPLVPSRAARSLACRSFSRSPFIYSHDPCSPPINPRSCSLRSRSLRSQVSSTFIPPPDAFAASAPDAPPPHAHVIASLGVAHSHALRAQLRATWFAGRKEQTATDPYVGAAFEESLKFVPKAHHAEIVAAANRADAILRLANSVLAKCLQDPECPLDSIGASAVHAAIDGMSWVQGSCERLATALVPFPYMLLVHRAVLFYVLTVPFALAASMGYYTILFNAIIAYTFFGLDEVARLMEQPFGAEPLCLGMEAICRTIETSVLEATGGKVRGAMVPDKRHCLM